MGENNRGTVSRATDLMVSRLFKMLPDPLFRFLYSKSINKSFDTFSMSDSRERLRVLHDPTNFSSLPANIERRDQNLDITFIIPVYNSTEYLEQSIESIFSQKSLPSFEIIAINDGSTDNSLEVLESIRHNRNELTIISQHNRGQGAARNVGMQFARGRYFCFVDSDDMLESTWVSSCLQRLVESKADYICTPFTRIDSTGNRRMGTSGYNRAEFRGLSPWGAIFKREVWDDIVFPEGVWYEDAVVDMCISTRYKGVFVDNPGYLYRYQNNSISSRSYSNPRSVDAYWVVEFLLRWCRQLTIPFNQYLLRLTLEKLGPVLLHWTNGLPISERLDLFITSCGLLDSAFGGQALSSSKYGRWCDLHEAYKSRSFKAWELVCRTL